MSVHSTGTGSAWNTTLDVDQPHGLDYREFNDIRLGIGKRIGKEHLSFADLTVGGEHIPGGCNVLYHQDSSNAPADLSSKSGDSTGYHAGGLYCLTGYDGTSCVLGYYDDATSPTPIKMTPGSICLGADWTWTGVHEFDASVCITSYLVCNSVNIVGGLLCSSGAYLNNDVTCNGVLAVNGDISGTAGLIIDGTALFRSNIDISGNCDISGTLSVTGDISVSDMSGAVAQRLGKVWGHADFTTNTVHASYGTNGVDWSSDGIVCVSFSSALASDDYAILLTMKSVGTGGNHVITYYDQSTGGFHVSQRDGGNDALSNDNTEFCYLVFI